MPNGHRTSSPHHSSSVLPRIPSLGVMGSAVSDHIPAYIPGFKTSAAFLSSLGANLRIPDDALLPSPISTPSSLRPASDYSGSFAPPSPILAAMGSSDHLDHLPSVTSAPSQKSPSANPPAIDLLAGVPSLSTFVATSSQDRHDALKLVADSVAQQRQMASRAVMSSPLTTALFIALTILVSNLLVREKGDWALVFTTMGGVVMAGLVGVRWMVGPYLAQAENIARWEWLGDDTIISTKYGDKMIGTLVLGWEGEAGKKNNKKKGKGGRGVIRAWTVLLKYRGKGEGRMLLEEAAKVVQQRNGDGLGFEEDGIYSERVLPKVFNSPFLKRDQKAYDALDKVMQERGSFQKKR